MTISDRDTLAELIHAAICEDSWEHECLAWDGKCIRAAEQQLAAGVRPPAREITDPAELPTGSIVVRDGVAYQCEGEWWSMRGTRTRWDKPHGTGPIILLYVPTEEAGRG